MDMPDANATEKFRIHYVRVTNNMAAPFTDRHDGVPVRILPGKSENFPLDMAAHFFGYAYGVPADVMFRHTCKRQGWNTQAHLATDETGKTLAERYFAGLEIKPVIYKMVEEEIDDRNPIPADPQPKLDDDELPSLKRMKAGAA